MSSKTSLVDLWPFFIIIERKAASCPSSPVLDDVHIKIQNMRFKFFTNDQIVFQRTLRRLCPQKLGRDGSIEFLIRSLNGYRQGVVAILFFMKRFNVVVCVFLQVDRIRFLFGIPRKGQIPALSIGKMWVKSTTTGSVFLDIEWLIGLSGN